MLPYCLQDPKLLLKLDDFLFKTINSNNINRKIRITKDRIKLLILAINVEN